LAALRMAKPPLAARLISARGRGGIGLKQHLSTPTDSSRADADPVSEAAQLAARRRSR